MLTGQNGILTKANEAKTVTENANALEAIKTEVAGSFDNTTGKYSPNIAYDNLKNNLKIDDNKIENNNGSILLEYKEKYYTVGSSGIVGQGGNWNGSINTPILTEGMTPIIINSDGTETQTNANDQNWYDYSENNGTNNTKWANVKMADGSYFVWIPRYEYEITQTTDTTPSDTNAGTIDVRFISTNTKEGTQGYTTIDGITKSADNYTIHPAFTNSIDNGGWRSELAGIWVAKYEMSMETNGIATETSDSTIGNVLTSSTIKAVSKPGVTSWRCINIGNCYTNGYNYDRTKESHLIKNSEWGAVAYLTHSKYGRDRTEVTMNDQNYYTGGASGAKAITNPSQSSTGNASGIFDLSGGAHEYVAVWDTASTSNYISNNGSSFARTGGESTQYATTYTNGTSNYIPTQALNIPGDATYEVYVNESRAWFNDYSRFVFSGYPFLSRGGVNYNGSDAGIFAAYHDGGGRRKQRIFPCGVCHLTHFQTNQKNLKQN